VESGSWRSGGLGSAGSGSGPLAGGEFPGAMARHAFADDLACRHIERRKQSCRAVTFIVVRHGAGAPLLEGQTWLRAIEGLDLAFLVDGKHQSFFGRIEIEADDPFA
jgi:hypothetical protein